MCGILAHVAFEEKARISEETLKGLNGLLTHRGPDSGGIYRQDEVGLAIRRLSIIDLKTGDQPIFSEDSRYVIVFNGEIYNYQELRQNLLKRGYRFKTNSDTEVLLYSFIDEGPACLSRLNGMFAFAVWDNKKRELFLARDRLGVKPLYYAIDESRVLFSSEITPLYRSHFFPRRLNIRAISDYLAYWYICEPETIFEGMFQLPAGHYAFVRNRRLEKFRYWQVPNEGELDISYSKAQERLRDLLEDAVRLRIKVDVPIGTFLSGGIDSGLVTAFSAKHIAHRLKSFAIGFPQKSYSEIDLAQKTARRYDVDLHAAPCPDMTPDILEHTAGAFDEPLGNASFVPTFFLAQSARRDVKVVLTGDGGDELFGGYPTYQAPYYLNMYRRFPGVFKTLLKKVVQNIPVAHERISLDFRLKQLMKGLDYPYTRAHFTWREVGALSVQKELFHEDVWEKLSGYDPFSRTDAYFAQAKNLSVKNQYMFVDLNTYLLNDHLRKVDRMTMAHSLEARLPYMDYRIVELAMRLPEAYKVTFFQTKKILKDMAKDFLPAAVVNGPKKGLTPPIAHWLAGPLKDYAGDQLQGGIMDQLFEKKTIRTLWEEFLSHRCDHSRLLWALLTLKVWSKNLEKK